MDGDLEWSLSNDCGVTVNREWVESTWANADFGDTRLPVRCQKIVMAMLDGMGASIPGLSEKWADTKAIYRFLDNSKISHEAIQEPHWNLTVQEAREHEGVVLWIQDGSELLFNGHDFLTGCGPTADQYGNGMLIHTCLTVGWTLNGGALYGVSYQTAWTRGETSAAPRAEGTRESSVWSETLRRLGEVPEGHKWVTVCDRGADCYEFFNQALELHWGLLVRLSQNRTVVINGVVVKLLDYARSLESIGSKTLELRARGDQGKRTVTLEYAAGSAVLPVPRGIEGSPIPLNVVRIWGDGLEWVLLTTLPADSLDELKTLGKYYETRWVIEEYHKSLKTGTKIESSQLRTARRIMNLLGLLGVVAAQLLILKDIARTDPDLSAAKVVPQGIIDVVRTFRPKLSPTPSVRDLVRAIASMGGFLCRKGDGEPGWITIWRGWLRIQTAREFLALQA